MKKFVVLIMLLCLSIIFTGCSNNNNSNANTNTKTLSISVSSDIINATNTSVRAASVPISNIKLYFNGVEFPGHTKDSYGNYIFSKIMYEDAVYNMAYNTSSSTVQIYYNDLSIEPFEIVFKKVDFINSNNISIYTLGGKIIVLNGTEDKTVIEINGERQVDIDKISKVQINKITSLSAEIRFFNELEEGMKIKNFASSSWKISALNDELQVIQSWTSDDNLSNLFLDIKENGTTKNYYYTISLTDSGIATALSHNLDNTSIKIDYIRNKTKDLVDTDVLTEAVYYHP